MRVGIHATIYAIHNGTDEPVATLKLKSLLKRRIAFCQYRKKPSRRSELLSRFLGKPTLRQSIKEVSQARLIRRWCRRYGVSFIVNDSVHLARYLGADGVHLGQSELGQIHLAKRHLVQRYRRPSQQKFAGIGVSCQDSFGKAKRAQQLGANYVSFGALFDTQTKQDAHQANWRKVSYASHKIALPVVIIGGIKASNLALVSRLGYDFFAISSAIEEFIN